MMGIAGRKRKLGHREPNGDIKRPSAAERARIAAEKAREVCNVAKFQPHRRGDDSPMLESPLGQFVKAAKLHEALYDAGCEYAGVVHRYAAAWGAQDGIRLGEGDGTGDGPSMATVGQWKAYLESAERALGQDYLAVRRLTVAGVYPSAIEFASAANGLFALARHLGKLARNHPFRA